MGLLERMKRKLEEWDNKADVEGAEARLEKAQAFMERGFAYRKQVKEKKTAGVVNGAKDEDRIRQFIAQPATLSKLSDDELDLLHIQSKHQLEICERDYSTEERNEYSALKSANVQHQLSNPLISPLADILTPRKRLEEKQHRIDNRKLLLKLIEHEESKRKSSKATTTTPSVEPPSTKEEKRVQLLAEIDNLQSQKSARVNTLRDRSASEDEIKRNENMFDDAISNRERELSELLA